MSHREPSPLRHSSTSRSREMLRTSVSNSNGSTPSVAVAANEASARPSGVSQVPNGTATPSGTGASIIPLRPSLTNDFAKPAHRIASADILRSRDSSYARLGMFALGDNGADSGTGSDILEVEEQLAKQRRERRRKVSISVIKAKERTTRHINQFIRIHVRFRDKKKFPVTVDRTQTIEYVARQIEAEYAIRYMIESSPKRNEPQQYSENDLLSSIAIENGGGGDLGLIHITQLYDAGNLAMQFPAKVGDLLAFDDVITAVTTEEVTLNNDIDEEDDVIKELASEGLNLSGSKFNSEGENLGSAFELHNLRFSQTAIRKSQQESKQNTPSANSAQTGNVTPTKSSNATDASSVPREPSGLARTPTVKYSSLDERLQSVLHNIISMQFFNEFCLQEFTAENPLFWIEVEIYKSISDPLIRRVFAQYIYLTYIAPDKAPLKVNISTDVLRDIPWPVPENPPPTFFDEVQEHVYAMIKGHSYARFEKSKIFERFLEFKSTDRYTYIQSRVLWSFDRMFNTTEHLDEIAEAIQILENPSTPEAQRALDEFGEGQFTNVASLLFRQSMLGKIIGRYFPLVSPVIRGYFNQTNRSKWAGRQKRVLKEKKLTRFFGQRPTAEHMLQQQVMGNSNGAGNGDHSSRVSSRASIISDSESSEVSPDSTLGLSEKANLSVDPNMRKKAEKLVGFFGESRLPKKQMRRQLNASADVNASGMAIDVMGDDDADMDDEYDYDDDERKYEMNASNNRLAESGNGPMSPSGPMSDSENDDVIPIGTQNELSAEERRALNRRARKLRTVLGETLDERTVTNKITGPVVLQKASSAEGVNIDKSDPASHTTSFVTSPSANALLSTDGSFIVADAAAASPTKPSPDGSSGSALTPSPDEQNAGANSSRLVLKARLDKLSQFLGHRISENDIIGAQAHQAAAAQQAARPLTSVEKKKYQRQSTKLERLLGSTVPAQAILNYNAGSGVSLSSSSGASALVGASSQSGVAGIPKALAASGNNLAGSNTSKTQTARVEVDLNNLLSTPLPEEASSAVRLLSQVLDAALDRSGNAGAATSPGAQTEPPNVLASETNPVTLDQPDASPETFDAVERKFTSTPSSASISSILNENKPGDHGKKSGKGALDPFEEDDDEDDEEARKRQKQQRLNKLRKILGSDIKVGVVLEKQFLDFIERSISESLEDPEEREVLTEGLKRLKTIAEKRAADTTTTAATGAGPSSSGAPAYTISEKPNEVSPNASASNSSNDLRQQNQGAQSPRMSLKKKNPSTDSLKQSNSITSRLNSLATSSMRKSPSFGIGSKGNN